MRAVSSSLKHEGGFAFQAFIFKKKVRQMSSSLKSKSLIFVPEVKSQPPNSSCILLCCCTVDCGPNSWMWSLEILYESCFFWAVDETCKAVQQCYWCLTYIWYTFMLISSGPLKNISDINKSWQLHNGSVAAWGPYVQDFSLDHQCYSYCKSGQVKCISMAHLKRHE